MIEAMGVIDKKNSQYLNSNIKTKENLVISNVKKIQYKVFSDIEGYIKVSTKGDSEFNFVDETVVNRLQVLNEHLKGGNYIEWIIRNNHSFNYWRGYLSNVLYYKGFKKIQS